MLSCAWTFFLFFLPCWTDFKKGSFFYFLHMESNMIALAVEIPSSLISLRCKGDWKTSDFSRQSLLCLTLSCYQGSHIVFDVKKSKQLTPLKSLFLWFLGGEGSDKERLLTEINCFLPIQPPCRVERLKREFRESKCLCSTAGAASYISILGNIYIAFDMWKTVSRDLSIPKNGTIFSGQTEAVAMKLNSLFYF